jgi:hypothetical protein
MQVRMNECVECRPSERSNRSPRQEVPMSQPLILVIEYEPHLQGVGAHHRYHMLLLGVRGKS